MNIYPKNYLDSVKDINIDFLRKNEIRGLILDIDNTLIDIDKKMLDGAPEWCENLKNSGIKICILSNTSNKEKAENVANALNIQYINFAKKPLKKGFYRAQKLLDLECKNIGVVGDQLLTDVLGANRVGMYSILVKPVDERDLWYTKIKRPIENFLIKRWLQKKESDINCT